KPLLAKLPDSVLKDGIINDVANNFGTGSEQFLTKFRKTVTGMGSIKKPKVSTKVTPVRLAIALLLEHPHIVKALGDISALRPLTIPGVDLLTQLLELCQQNPAIKTAQLLEYFRDTAEGKQLAKLMCWQHNTEAEAAQDVFLDSIEKLLNDFVEQRAEFLLQKARTGQMSKQEKQELQAILNA
ncbi:MAG: DNA primase, partial [Colwellia sp.]|nr:DNA primase [Colwellia sp.]